MTKSEIKELQTIINAIHDEMPTFERESDEEKSKFDQAIESLYDFMRRARERAFR